MGEFKSFKKESRQDWGHSRDLPKTTTDEVMLGAVLRIADATEVMAKNYNVLLSECERYKSWALRSETQRRSLERRLTAMKGHLTRAKRKLRSNRELTDG